MEIIPEFVFPHSRSLRTKFSCKESQGEDSDDELDEVDEELSSSAVFCAAICLRLLAACLLNALAFAESLSSRDLLGTGILLFLCVFCAICFRVNSVTSPACGPTCSHARGLS